MLCVVKCCERGMANVWCVVKQGFIAYQLRLVPINMHVHGSSPTQLQTQSHPHHSTLAAGLAGSLVSVPSGLSSVPNSLSHLHTAKCQQK
jgi:hypothetical protein